MIMPVYPIEAFGAQKMLDLYPSYNRNKTSFVYKESYFGHKKSEINRAKQRQKVAGLAIYFEPKCDGGNMSCKCYISYLKLGIRISIVIGFTSRTNTDGRLYGPW